MSAWRKADVSEKLTSYRSQALCSGKHRFLRSGCRNFLKKLTPLDCLASWQIQPPTSFSGRLGPRANTRVKCATRSPPVANFVEFRDSTIPCYGMTQATSGARMDPLQSIFGSHIRSDENDLGVDLLTDHEKSSLVYRFLEREIACVSVRIAELLEVDQQSD